MMLPLRTFSLSKSYRYYTQRLKFDLSTFKELKVLEKVELPTLKLKVRTISRTVVHQRIMAALIYKCRCVV
jgi:hypothetical protein